VQAATESQSQSQSLCCARVLTTLTYSYGHIAYDQAVRLGAQDRRAVSREEGARAALHQDTPDFEFDQRKHQVGASSFFHNLSNVII
jgi:hypothetical protein